MNFLNELNESQLNAVKYIDGPALVIAGAGSGKTRVLTYKIAYLLSRGVHPSSILSLTFTNKAANEMRKRIGELIGFQTAKYIWMGTFHSIFSKILRAEAQLIGFTKDFTIYDSADSKSLIKSIIKELELDDKIYKPGAIHSRISFAKNNLYSAEAYYNNSDFLKSDTRAKVPQTNEIFAIYASRCRQANAMDFDDLLLMTNILFRNHPDVLKKYQQLFNYILVDEYQDTNFAQYLIVKKLAEEHERICVVGDDAQSIYSFRGANINNILNFQQSYPKAQLFKLEQNYRSTQNIVNAANSLIDKNSEQIRKTIFSNKEKGDPILITSTITDFEEATLVAERIKNKHQEEEKSFNNFAVLYRTNSQSRILEEKLRNLNIPYRIYGGLSFYQRKEIKDMIAYFRLVANNDDEEALKRIINYPARGIGNITLEKLINTAHLHQVSCWQTLADPLAYNVNINAGTALKLANFRELIEINSQQVNTLDAYEMANNIVKSSGLIADATNDNSAEGLSRLDNIQELLKAIHEFCELKRQNENIDIVTLPDFLSEVSLLTDQDADKDTNEEKVTLMTIHAAKGLEFETVFIVGLEEQLFPSPFAETPRELEEERRLFYVAITRAEKECFISYSKSRFKNGQMNFANPSRFLHDIDNDFIKHDEDNSTLIHDSDRHNTWDSEIEMERGSFKAIPHLPKYYPKTESHRSKNLTKIGVQQSEKQVVDISGLPVGSFVKHNIFGVGKIMETSIVDGNKKAEIDFGEKGKKSLLLKFAKLELLE